MLRGDIATSCWSWARYRRARVARSDVFVIIATNQTIFIRLVPGANVTGVTLGCDVLLILLFLNHVRQFHQRYPSRPPRCAVGLPWISGKVFFSVSGRSLHCPEKNCPLEVPEDAIFPTPCVLF